MKKERKRRGWCENGGKVGPDRMTLEEGSSSEERQRAFHGEQQRGRGETG